MTDLTKLLPLMTDLTKLLPLMTELSNSPEITAELCDRIAEVCGHRFEPRHQLFSAITFARAVLGNDAKVLVSFEHDANSLWETPNAVVVDGRYTTPVMSSTTGSLSIVLCVLQALLRRSI